MRKIYIYQLVIVVLACMFVSGTAQATRVTDTSKINETGGELELRGTLGGDYINGKENNAAVIQVPDISSGLKKYDDKKKSYDSKKDTAKKSVVNTGVGGIPKGISDFGQSPSNPNGGPSINDVLTGLDNAAGDSANFMNIFKNAIAGFLSGGGNGGKFDFGPILSSLFGSIVGEHGSVFNSQAENSFKAASASNSVFASLLNQAGIPSLSPTLGDHLVGDSNTAHLGGLNGGSDLDCMTKVVCSEARGESMTGKIAVAHVVLNRVKKRKLSVCGVIYQKSQFENIRNYNVSRESAKVQGQCRQAATYVMNGAPDITKGADHFAALSVITGRGQKLPSWTRTMRAVARVGGHTFYRSA